MTFVYLNNILNVKSSNASQSYVPKRCLPLCEEVKRYPWVCMYNKKHYKNIELGSVYGLGHSLSILECISHRNGR